MAARASRKTLFPLIIFSQCRMDSVVIPISTHGMKYFHAPNRSGAAAMRRALAVCSEESSLVFVASSATNDDV